MKESKQPVKEKERNCDCGLCFKCGRFQSNWKALNFEWMGEEEEEQCDSLASSEVSSELADELDLLVQQPNPIEMTPLRRSRRLAGMRNLASITSWIRR